MIAPRRPGSAWSHRAPTRPRRSRPFSRLLARLSREGRALAGVAGVGLLFGVDVGRGASHVLSIATLALLGASLLVSRAYRARGLSVIASVPQRVAVGEELCVGIELSNGGPATLHRLRVEPIAAPAGGQITELPADVEQLVGGARHRTLAKLRFERRGAHHLEPFRAAALVPLGLAQGTAQESRAAAFLVVPKVARVTQVRLPLGRTHQPGGSAGPSRTGETLELAGVRPYRPGDPLRDLHARSWARHAVPMVRQYREEYFTRVGLVVDTDASASSPAQLEAALSLAAGVIACLCRGETLVDVLVAGERAEPLGLGRHLASLERALDALASVRAGATFASERLLGQLAPHLASLSSVVLVALAWDDARRAFVRTLAARGLATRVYLVGGGVASSPELQVVPLAAITGGEELSL